ncbi:MAG TPA: TlpA disulfide reductase family protein [Mycobacteriales bacterium]|nr:TlpA disulfide reductase family protein [Mycobacteriales bacterium]
MSRIAAGLVAAVAAVLATTGCSASSLGTPGDHSARNGSTAHARLVAKAHLAPCPESGSASASGGLPDVTLDCLGSGPAVHVSGLTGMPTVVNVWGSWCVPCQEEASVLSSVYDADRGKVRFLGVDTADDANSALDFGTHVKPPVRYPSVLDPDKKVLLGLAKAPGPPETAFLDISGAVVHVHIGPYSSAAALRADLATYLQVK